MTILAPLLPAIPPPQLTLGAWGALGACLALTLPPLFSHFVHPYLHMRHEDAVNAAPPVTAWLLQRWYFLAMARNHYLHHRYVASNFNLVLGDDLLRGKYRVSSPADIFEMQRLGLRTD